MLLITTIDMVTGLTDADCKLLAGYTAKDKIIVLSKEGAMMPVAMFQTLSALKCQLEIKEIDTKDLFQLGYTIGRLTASVKNTEKIIILTNKELDVDDKNIIRTESLAGTKGAKATAKAAAPKVSAKAPAKEEPKVTVKAVSKADVAKVASPKVTPVKNTAPKSTPAKNTAPKATPVKNIAPKATTSKVAAVKDAASKATGSKLWPIISKYSKMKPYKEFVLKNEEALMGAILSAGDADITFKFQLQLNFGADGVDIWEILHKNFEEIQAKVKDAK